MFGFGKEKMPAPDGEEIVAEEAMAQRDENSMTDISPEEYAKMSPKQRADRWPDISKGSNENTAEAA